MQMLSRAWPKNLAGIVIALGLGLVPPCQLFWMTPTTMNREIVIYIYGDFAHTNVLVPTRSPSINWQEYFPIEQLGTQAQTYRYLGFGWGERELYRQLTPLDQIPPDVAWRALFTSTSPATLHVQGFAQLPQAPLAEFIVPITLNQSDYLALHQYLWDSFERDAQGQPIWLNQSRQANSSFYAATGQYSAWNTCNSWTAQALRQANIQPPLWDTLALPLFYHLQWRNLCHGLEQTL